MLAYVFWHAAPGNITPAQYEKVLLAFTQRLSTARCPGFLGNASYAISETPWLGEAGYEDWTWLLDSSALDRLNEVAVSGAMEKPHDAIAQLTKHGGFGALYYLAAGAHAVLDDSKTFWLSRPRGIRWSEAIADLMKSAHPNLAVWRRFMVLGPAPEFAVMGPPGLTLTVPPDWQTLEVDRRRIK